MERGRVQESVRQQRISSNEEMLFLHSRQCHPPQSPSCVHVCKCASVFVCVQVCVCLCARARECPNFCEQVQREHLLSDIVVDKAEATEGGKASKGFQVSDVKKGVISKHNCMQVWQRVL